MINNTIGDIANWQFRKNLHKMPYNRQDEVKNIIEECLETTGLRSDTARSMAADYVKTVIDNYFTSENPHADVDCFCDIVVYAIGAIMKLGYDPETALNECFKEIDERTGAYNPEEGKWVKEPAKEDAYKANYELAKRNYV